MRPALGTRCAECKCCPAQMFVGDVPVCLDCEDGRVCSYARAAKMAKPETPDVFEVIIPRKAPYITQKLAKVAPIEKSEAMTPPTAKKRATAPKERIKVTTKEITPELAAQIKAEWASGTKINSIANKYGITWYQASQLKPKGGKKESRFDKKPAQRQCTLAADTPQGELAPTRECLCGGPSTVCCSLDCQGPAPEPPIGYAAMLAQGIKDLGPAVEEIEKTLAATKTLADIPATSINIQFTEEEAIAMFSMLSAAQKSEALKSAFINHPWR